RAECLRRSRACDRGRAARIRGGVQGIACARPYPEESRPRRCGQGNARLTLLCTCVLPPPTASQRTVNTQKESVLEERRNVAEVADEEVHFAMASLLIRRSQNRRGMNGGHD